MSDLSLPPPSARRWRGAGAGAVPATASHTAPVTDTHLVGTRMLFASLCLFLLAQAYMIPVLTVGSWAMWPKLADIAIVAMGGALVFELRNIIAASRANQIIGAALFGFFAFCFVAYVTYITFIPDFGASGVRFGAFQLYLIAQGIFAFWVAAHVPLTPQRVVALRLMVDAALLVVIASIVATYFEIIPLADLTPHISPDEDISGPWHRYLREDYGGQARGWGTVGYNHSYVASQVILLLGLRMNLSPKDLTITDSVYLLLAIMATFLSTSRAGLASMVLLAGILWLKKPMHAVATFGLAGLMMATVLVAAPSALGALGDDLQASIERQSALFDAGNADNLSGRDDIWESRIAFLDEDPIRWVIGGGFGWQAGDNAHMLPLQYIVELGLIGLVVFIVLFGTILFMLYRHERGAQALFWTTLTLFISAASQETFFPVPAMGGFLTLYFAAIAIGLRDRYPPDPAAPEHATGAAVAADRRGVPRKLTQR